MQTLKPKRIVCISAGMLQPKKADNPIARMHLYLNYGLLGLASILSDSGHEAIVAHGGFTEPETFVASLLGQYDTSRTIVLLSVPSSFALPWARRACAEARRLCPMIRIIVGGRWVVADDEPWVRGHLPDANLFVRGLAEDRVLSLVTAGGSGRSIAAASQSAARTSTIPRLNYRLLDHWPDFHPSLEVSRGCGRHCAFCLEAKDPLSPFKDAQQLANEFVDLARLYESEDIHPYLEASHFNPPPHWADEFRIALEVSGLPLHWRAETRADTLSPKSVHKLATVGLRVLDVGLESASPTQLVRMKKTRCPETYLRRASELLRACHGEGVWPKVNVLFYPGETRETVAETERWLEDHRAFVKGLSVGPTTLFRFGTAHREFLRELGRLGASVVDAAALDRDGFAHMHLSAHLPHQAALHESRRISQSFMSARDYYDLKSFSYLPRQLSWSAFCDILRSSPDVEYSFQT